MIGFSSFAPHVLIGLAARELVPASQSSTAGGLVTMVSRTGGALAGAPIGFLADKYGWEGVLTFLIGMSVVGGLATISLWNIGGTSDEKDAEKKKRK
jgi:sugar phosphate permease